MEEKKVQDSVFEDETTVFVRKLSDIRETGRTQCKEHVFRKLSENEVACTRCDTALIVAPEAVDKMVAI